MNPSSYSSSPLGLHFPLAALLSLTFIYCTNNGDDTLSTTQDIAIETAVIAGRPTLLNIHGDVRLNGKTAVTSQSIPLYAELSVGTKSVAIIRFDQGNVAEIRAGSTVKFGTSKRKKHSLRLFVGTVWSFLQDGANYEIDTGNAVAGVRGTVFFTEVDPHGGAYVCACDGAIELTSHSDNFHRVLRSDNAHIAVDLAIKKGTLHALAAKRRNHSDSQADKMSVWCKQAKEQSDKSTAEVNSEDAQK